MGANQSAAASWPKAQVPYEIDVQSFETARHPELINVIKQAIEAVSKNTRVKFIDNSQASFPNDDCLVFAFHPNLNHSEWIGRSGGYQYVYLTVSDLHLGLAKESTLGIILHLMMHALGFVANLDHQYLAVGSMPDNQEMRLLGDYDSASVMHHRCGSCYCYDDVGSYGTWRLGLSQSDIEAINQLYSPSKSRKK